MKIFFFMRLCSKLPSYSFFIAAVFFKKAAIIIATYGQKTLRLQLGKVYSLVCTTKILKQ